MVIIDLDYVKNFLRVDFTEDDKYINLLIEVAKDYICDAVGIFDENNSRHKLLLLNIVSELYEKREFTGTNNQKCAYTMKSIIRQLQLKEIE